MTDLQTAASDSRRAVGAFVAAARAVPAYAWTRPAAPGKWSPGQVTEHVALAYELSLAVLRKTYTGFSLPRLMRPFARPEMLTARLQSSSAALEADLAVATRAGQTAVDHPFFGRLPLTDLLRLQVIHTQHHRRQLPGVAG